MVEAGFGIALLPESGVQEELAAGSLTVLEVAGLDVSVPVVLDTRRDGYLSAAARALCEELRRQRPGGCRERADQAILPR